MLPSILARQLQKGIGDYIETTFPMTNAPFKGSVRRMLEARDAVYHEPYVSVRLPFRLAEQIPACFEAIHFLFRPYVHQKKAFERLTGEDGRSTLIATGTGSGKTECFLYPILEYCYQHRGERGIKALIIYPMNALASDQAKRIAELINGSPELKGNVTAGMYVGGREHTPGRVMSEHAVITDHETLLASPPDILMTNYKMLDYLLVRPGDTRLWHDNGPETLKYIAVDEFHTFDGAQGTDLACLLRRLKHRLSICSGFLCCIGTSATMGSKENNAAIIKYASEVFGEPFEQDSIITEDRLSALEFFEGMDIAEFAMPDPAQVEELDRCAAEDDPSAYLTAAVHAWFPDFPEDVLGDEARIELGKRLMHHSFMQAVLNLTGGAYYQASGIAKELCVHYPELKQAAAADTIINSLFALISHARTGMPGKLRPFLNVQVQLWMRELRRLVAKVDPKEITFAIAHDLNKQQSKQYLPVINCRDCGITGWASVLNEKSNASMTSLEAFYNQYFRCDEKIVMMFPHPHAEAVSGMIPARLCPECLQVKIGSEGTSLCPGCDAEMIEVLIPSPVQTAGPKDHRQYVCPCCGSRGGLALMGIRSATEISASISQMFASRFNDDKKTLAFSDNVQDAAHRAGFFNSRTWRFGVRTAIQQYSSAFGAGQSVADFQDGFIRYWRERMTDEEFVSFFIAPNMTWMHAYEDMVANRKLGHGGQEQTLLREIEQRIRYEILLEFGANGKIGRSLEKSGCAVLRFAQEDIIAMADMVQERTINELGLLTSLPITAFRRMVLGYLDLMRSAGAFADPVFDDYTLHNGNGYMLSNDYKRWLPGRTTPRFIAVQNMYAHKSGEFDYPGSPVYLRWIISCADTFCGMDEMNYRDIAQIILDCAVKQGVVVTVPSSPEYKIYALNKQRVYVSENVTALRCSKCGSVTTAAAEHLELWNGAPCRRDCGGMLEIDENAALGYYGKLYNSGDLARINAREHTGLLERPAREQLEIDFKRGKDTQALWDPNVLSCTPTLEMGIDIGDLSTVILCSMPPAQSQFLQRAGRAGRKDGNALTLAIANAKPHDLYFYADPLDMIAGNVVPPRIFLRASAVLERQFAAFCMDSWVRKGVPEKAIPENVGPILNRLDSAPRDLFPFNFLNYVQQTLSRQLNSFMQMFDAYLDAGAKAELTAFARGTGTGSSPMSVKILDAFQSLKKQVDALHTSVQSLKQMIADLESKPKDSSYDEELKELKREVIALLSVQQDIRNKNIFNFLSDEGLLPNYAFPEAGIILRAILYRKEEQERERKNYEKITYEYSRSASSAISEFAPNNHFYVEGRKLTIDQVDLTTAQTARWRLCPNCSHAQLEESGSHTSCCPQCGSTAWADQGQLRSMLKVQMVYSNMDYTRSLISDDSEDRSNIFYTKQLLVDVDEANDITCAFRMDNEDFPFGYEFVRKATLREINFGESDSTGEKLTVSGIEEVRKGFRICKYCGKIQQEHQKPNHTYSCKTRKMTAAMQTDAYEEYLFLYREFTTEALRLLVPATTLDASAVKMESFVAAFMLGMREYFGNVDHLRAAVSDVPVADADYRKQYLVIYDSVPGGTGYLKQLMNEKDALIDIFEKALQVMENCSCKEDPQKDGCYHCLYAYRQSRQIGSISRAAAIRMLKSILSGKSNLEKIPKLNDIPVNPIIESELERLFMEAVCQRVGAANVSDTIRNGKHSYHIRLGERAWEIEPQVTLDAGESVKVKCKPDFVIWPLHNSTHLPVAVFTDGFNYHKDIAADDTLKREAIRRSGNYRVWSLSYRDVQSVFADQGSYCTETLDAAQMPYGIVYTPTVKKAGADRLAPCKLSSFDLLMQYLQLEQAEELFRAHAHAYSLALLDPKILNNSMVFGNWKMIADAVINQTHYSYVDFCFGKTAFGSWSPRAGSSHLTIHAGISMDSFRDGKSASVCAVLQDDPKARTENYEKEWNGFWRFHNLMQFAKEFVAVSSTGMEKMVYCALPVAAAEPLVAAVPAEKSPWDTVMGMLFGDDAQTFAKSAAAAGIPAPQEEDIEYELTDNSGAVIAAIEIAWPDRKIGFMTAEQLTDRAAAEAQGWTILELLSAGSITQYFGGNM